MRVRNKLTGMVVNAELRKTPPGARYGKSVLVIADESGRLRLEKGDASSYEVVECSARELEKLRKAGYNLPDGRP